MIFKKYSFPPLLIFALCATYIPLNYIVGSHAGWFSCATMLIPALAYQHSLLYVIFYFFTKTLCSSSFSYLLILHRLPTLMAALALRSWDITIAVYFPLLAMVVFCMHPTGCQVYYYSWYWFIPILVYCFGKDTLYHRALIASFTAHAAGSVVWLYRGNIAPQVWTALMPVVAIERLLIAGGMIVCITLLQAFDAWCHDKVIA